MTDRIIVITGGRDLTDRAPIWFVLDKHLFVTGWAKSCLTVYEGGCETGADLFTRQWVEDREKKTGAIIEHRSFFPNVARHGSPAAFHIRNREMVDTAVKEAYASRAELYAAAFPGKGPGTKTTIKLLAKAGIETQIVNGVK